jgi:hypothetical protein
MDVVSYDLQYEYGTPAIEVYFFLILPSSFLQRISRFRKVQTNY